MKHKSIFDVVIQKYLRAYRKRNAELYIKEGLCVFVLIPEAATGGGL